MSDDKRTSVDGRVDDTRPKARPSDLVAAPGRAPEMGSSSIAEIEGRPEGRPVKAGRGGGLVAWVLLILAIAGGTYFILRQHLPLTDEVADLKAKLATAHKESASLADEVKTLQGTQADLAAQVAKREQELQALQGTQDELSKKLESEIEKGNVAISQSRGQIVVDLVDKILFPSGEAELSDEGKNVLKQVGETFLKVPDKVIQVGGHTDDVPISPKLKDRFPSNWELSAARALNVVHYLQDEIKVPGQRLVAAGLAEFRPKASNKTPTGRKKNRRIEVVLLPLTPPGK